MNSIPCRECAAPVNQDTTICPKCGAPRPAQPEWEGEGFEWRTHALWMGAPVIHVAFGNDRTGRPRTACGVIAIGQRAVGAVAVGILAGGFISIGVVSAGVFSLGVVSIGALMALGVNALAPLAIGVVAVGYQVGGVTVVGWKVLFAIAR